MGERRRVAWILVVVCGCTEANPFADADTGSSTGAGTTEVGGSTGTASTPIDTGSSSPDADASTTNDPSVGTTGETACQIGTHLCVAPAPAGWSGPVALLDDSPEDDEPSCGEPFATAETVVFDQLIAPPAECACGCGNPSGAGCVKTLYVDNSAGCGSPTAEFELTGGCVTDVVGAVNQYWRATTEDIHGNCTEQLSEEIVDAEFGQRHTLCAPVDASSGVCPDGDVCAPIPIAPFAANSLCIWADGDLECPLDVGYDERRLVYRDFTDTRACSTCTCDVAGECTGSVYLFNSGCDGKTASGTLVLDGACVQFPAGINEAQLAMNQVVDASCEPSGGQAVGSAEGVEPVTVCCRG